MLQRLQLLPQSRGMLPLLASMKDGDDDGGDGDASGLGSACPIRP